MATVVVLGDMTQGFLMNLIIFPFLPVFIREGAGSDFQKHLVLFYLCDYQLERKKNLDNIKDA